MRDVSSRLVPLNRLLLKSSHDLSPPSNIVLSQNLSFLLCPISPISLSPLSAQRIFFCGCEITWVVGARQNIGRYAALGNLCDTTYSL